MIRLMQIFIALVCFSSVLHAATLSKENFDSILAYHAKNTFCGWEFEDEKLTKDDVMVVDKATSIVMVTCERGAYQSSYSLYRIDIDTGDIEIWPMSFAYTHDGKRFSGKPVLSEATFKAKTKSIWTFYKTRGAGGCGHAYSYKWSGSEFFLTKASYLPCNCFEEENKNQKQCKFLSSFPSDENGYAIVYRYKK